MAYPNSIDDIPTGTPGGALGDPHLDAHGKMAGSVRAMQTALGLNPPKTLTALITQQNGTDATLGSVTSTLPQHASRLTAIEAALADLEQRLPPVEAGLANLGPAVTALRAEVDGLQVEARDLLDRVAALEEELGVSGGFVDFDPRFQSRGGPIEVGTAGYAKGRYRLGGGGLMYLELAVSFGEGMGGGVNEWFAMLPEGWHRRVGTDVGFSYLTGHCWVPAAGGSLPVLALVGPIGGNREREIVLFCTAHWRDCRWASMMNYSDTTGFAGGAPGALDGGIAWLPGTNFTCTGFVPVVAG